MVAFQIITEGRGDGSIKQQHDAAFSLGFIVGVFYTLDDIDLKVCLPTQGGNNGQYAAVTKRYFDNNPNQLHRPAQALVREAAIQAFPCKR